MPLWRAELTRAQDALYEATLSTSHQAHTVAELWYRDRTLAAPLTDRNFPLDGQADLDGVIRTATCSIADPDGYLKLDTNLVFLDRILRAERWVYVTGIGDWVRVPFFTGPVIKADENGGVVTLEAHGFELWLSGDIKAVSRFPKGGVTSKTIRQLLTIGGVDPRYMSIPDHVGRLPDVFQVGPQYEGGIWTATQYLAETIDCDLFFDGRGWAILQQRPADVSWNFTTGPGGTVMGQPQKSMLIGGTSGGDATGLINDEIVFGVAKPVKPPKNPPPGYKPPPIPTIRGEAISKTGSRFAPDTLGFPGTDFYSKEVTHYDHCRTNKAAAAIAATRLARATSTAEQVTFDSAPVPHLNPFSRVSVDLPDYQTTVYLTKCTWPFNFTEGTPMTVGYNDLVHVTAPRHRT